MTTYTPVQYSAGYGTNPINASNRNTLETGLDAAKMEANNWVPPAGCIAWYPKYATPSGWLYCNGQAVSRTTYAALFSEISTTFGGGDGSTTFNVPDIRGYFVRGVDGGRGIDSGRTMGSTQADQNPLHHHSLTEYTPGHMTPSDTEGMLGRTTYRDSSRANANTTSYSGTEFRPKNIALIALIKT